MPVAGAGGRDEVKGSDKGRREEAEISRQGNQMRQNQTRDAHLAAGWGPQRGRKKEEVQDSVLLRNFQEGG